ncbi:hypothetical protein [Nocardia pseudovaccinii]|uniref:hypothetical protein n=1 Tax=Nocardia pseudovaccinii TaxID=189540 RepID=UPI0007A491BB|nr:hypothetical protein [Nocardia pseudovaccinii]
MLKSYKQLSRWYGALEPETGVAAPNPDEPGLRDPGDEDGAPRFPHYIREDDADEVRARNEVPADLASGRSEFTGGWSDWVAGRAPGPDDDYIGPRDGELVQFPWPEDDDHDHVPRERSTRATRALRQEARDHPAARRARVIAVLVVAVLLLAAAAAGAVLLLRSSGDRAAAPVVPSMQFTAGSVQSRGIADCPTERGDRIVRSAEPGGTDSGPEAILAFQYAYYVERSGERVRAVVAPDSNISSAAVIQHGIDTIPLGTTHCVRIQTITDDRYSVEVTEYRPGGAPATYNKQTVATVVVGGRTLITSVSAG